MHEFDGNSLDHFGLMPKTSWPVFLRLLILVTATALIWAAILTALYLAW